MNFIGTFILCFIITVLLFMIFSGTLNIWLLMLIIAGIMAAMIRIYLNITDRLDRIEQHLGIASSEETDHKPFTEQHKEDPNEENAP